MGRPEDDMMSLLPRPTQPRWAASSADNGIRDSTASARTNKIAGTAVRRGTNLGLKGFSRSQ